jgi:hypothetical protein
MRWLLSLVLLVTCSPRPAGPGASAPTAAKCATAIDAVRNYTAPGATERLENTLGRQLDLEGLRRPVQPRGWVHPPQDLGRQCAVYFRAAIGNEDVSLVWWWDPQTGRVEARDDRTRRLSGW